MVNALRKLAFHRPSHRPKHQFLTVEGGGGGKRISPAAALHGVPLLERFEGVEHPAEPSDVEDPVRCPLPENSILQDGLMWRDRVARNFQRPMERIRTWHKGDVDVARVVAGVSVGNPGRPNHSNTLMSEASLFGTHSAPEALVAQMLEA